MTTQQTIARNVLPRGPFALFVFDRTAKAGYPTPTLITEGLSRPEWYDLAKRLFDYLGIDFYPRQHQEFHRYIEDGKVAVEEG